MALHPPTTSILTIVYVIADVTMTMITPLTRGQLSSQTILCCDVERGVAHLACVATPDAPSLAAVHDDSRRDERVRVLLCPDLLTTAAHSCVVWLLSRWRVDRRATYLIRDVCS